MLTVYFTVFFPLPFNPPYPLPPASTLLFPTIRTPLSVFTSSITVEHHKISLARNAQRFYLIKHFMVGMRATEAPAREQGLLQDSWERARLGCVSSQVLVWTRGA